MDGESAMVEFRPVGIYAESYSKARPDLPSVRESITTVDLPDRARILDYMRAVTPSFDVLDVTVDLHDGQAKIKSGSSLVTDGVWVWRVDSVHHLAAHPLVIDEQFVAHVRARAYQAPADIEVTDEIEDALLKFF